MKKHYVVIATSKSDPSDRRTFYTGAEGEKAAIEECFKFLDQPLAPQPEDFDFMAMSAAMALQTGVQSVFGALEAAHEDAEVDLDSLPLPYLVVSTQSDRSYWYVAEGADEALAQYKKQTGYTDDAPVLSLGGIIKALRGMLEAGFPDEGFGRMDLGAYLDPPTNPIEEMLAALGGNIH